MSECRKIIREEALEQLKRPTPESNVRVTEFDESEAGLLGERKERMASFADGVDYDGEEGALQTELVTFDRRLVQDSLEERRSM